MQISTVTSHEEHSELLASKESIISSQQSRIAKLEDLHTLAQNSALKFEAELSACQKLLAAAKTEKEVAHGKEEELRYVLAFDSYISKFFVLRRTDTP
jgi:hypothetical protein